MIQFLFSLEFGRFSEGHTLLLPLDCYIYTVHRCAWHIIAKKTGKSLPLGIYYLNRLTVRLGQKTKKTKQQKNPHTTNNNKHNNNNKGQWEKAWEVVTYNGERSQDLLGGTCELVSSVSFPHTTDYITNLGLN